MSAIVLEPNSYAPFQIAILLDETSRDVRLTRVSLTSNPVFERNPFFTPAHDCVYDGGSAEERPAASALLRLLASPACPEILSLYDTDMRDEDLRDMATLLRRDTRIRELDLGGNHISDQSIGIVAEILRRNTTLAVLDLQMNDFSEGKCHPLAQALRENSRLCELNLGACELRDSIVITELAATLAHNVGLKRVTLNSNHIDDEGAASLADALIVNATLRALDLSFNDIGVTGVLLLEGALETNTTLLELDLVGNLVDTTTMIESRLERNLALCES